MTRYVKDPDDVADYGWDWAPHLLAGETITTSTWDVTAGLTSTDFPDSHTDTKTTIWLSGGSNGRTYAVTNHVTTNQGREKDKAFLVMVRSVTPDASGGNDGDPTPVGPVAWGDVTGKPTTFPPSAHQHAISNVNGLQDALDSKQAALPSPTPSGKILGTNGTAYVLVDPSAGGGGGGPAHGNGFPTGTPGVGTEYIDDDQTSGAVKWIYTNDRGWTVTVGETGERDIASLVSPDWTVRGSITLKRSGPQVTINARSIAGEAGNASASQVALILPLGFRPTSPTPEITAGESPPSPVTLWIVTANPDGSVVWGRFGAPSALDYSYVSLTFSTADPWPSTLPGTPYIP